MYCVMRASVPSLYNVYRRYDDSENHISLFFVSLFVNQCYDNHDFSYFMMYYWTVPCFSYQCREESELLNNIQMYISIQSACLYQYRRKM